MKIGLQIPEFKYPGGEAAIAPSLRDIGETAEAAGFASLWVMDHFFQLDGMIGPADDPMLEGYSTLTYLAGLTERITLGTLVTGVIYRNPGLLVKTATTLDVLSGGRAWLGIGAGWYEREAAGLGFDFPSTKERFEQLEETLQIAQQMWAGDRSPYKGHHFAMAEPINSPQVLSRPHPPIMIGGGGEKKTLRMVAQYADACNLLGFIPRDQLIHKLGVLQGHCERLGRNYDDIEKTVLSRADLGNQRPGDVVAYCRDLASIGFQHVIFNMPNAHEIEPLETFGREIIPAVAEL